MSKVRLKRPPFIRDGVGVIQLTRGYEAIVDIDIFDTNIPFVSGSGTVGYYLINPSSESLLSQAGQLTSTNDVVSLKKDSISIIESSINLLKRGFSTKI